MATRNDVESLLSEFKIKMSIWDIIILSRQKNDETILFLEISNAYVKKVLESLESIDYCEGPIEEKNTMGRPMWVFGKQVKGYEVYIKISLGSPNDRTICYSFHFPDYQMKYPFKT